MCIHARHHPGLWPILTPFHLSPLSLCAASILSIPVSCWSPCLVHMYTSRLLLCLSRRHILGALHEHTILFIHSVPFSFFFFIFVLSSPAIVARGILRVFSLFTARSLIRAPTTPLSTIAENPTDIVKTNEQSGKRGRKETREGEGRGTGVWLLAWPYMYVRNGAGRSAFVFYPPD